MQFVAVINKGSSFFSETRCRMGTEFAWLSWVIFMLYFFIHCVIFQGHVKIWITGKTKSSSISCCIIFCYFCTDLWDSNLSRKSWRSDSAEEQQQVKSFCIQHPSLQWTSSGIARTGADCLFFVYWLISVWY